MGLNVEFGRDALLCSVLSKHKNPEHYMEHERELVALGVISVSPYGYHNWTDFGWSLPDEDIERIITSISDMIREREECDSACSDMSVQSLLFGTEDSE